MNWDSTRTADFWEACKQKAIKVAVDNLADLETDFSMPEEQQANWTADQVTEAVSEGSDFMQNMKFPPRAMSDLMKAVPGILTRDPFGTTLQDCFAYCAYLELQDQIDPEVQADPRWSDHQDVKGSNFSLGRPLA